MTETLGRKIKLGVKIVLTLAVLAGLHVWVIRPLLASDEEKVRTLVDEVIENARKRHVGDILKSVAGDYQDPLNATREELREKLNYAAFVYPVWRVDVAEGPTVAVDPSGERATALIRASVRWGRAGEEPTIDYVAQARRTDRYRATLAKREGRWWIISCDGDE